MFDTLPVVDCAGRPLRLDRPRVMGIVNVTPDSFSDGGAHDEAAAAIAHGLRLVEGARTCWMSAASPPGPVRTRCRSRRNCAG